VFCLTSNSNSLPNEVVILENLVKRENLLSNNIPNKVAIFSKLQSKPSPRISFRAHPTLHRPPARRRLLSVLHPYSLSCMVAGRWDSKDPVFDLFDYENDVHG
jgi:hypothetical protein